jgi:hypothetical protein
MKYPRNPSKREIHNTLQGLNALHLGAIPQFKEKRTYTGRPYEEREQSSNDKLKAWRRRPDVRIWRNNVGFYKDGDRAIRYGLCPGSADFVGLHTITITPEMLNRKIAVFLAIESKARGKDAEDHQETWLQEVKDAGAIAGVARDGDEADALIAKWMRGESSAQDAEEGYK